MKIMFYSRKWLFIPLIIVTVFIISCGGSDYRIFSLREGIGHFSMEYPSEYQVTRIDVRNYPASRYTDIGLSSPAVTSNPGLNEISVYAWPAEPSSDTASLILTGMLAQGESIFADFRLLQRFSVMIGDIEGQAAVFSWTASPTTSSTELEANSLPAISRIVCFRHGDLAWEIHVASDEAVQDQAETEFRHILDTFQIMN